MIDARLAAALRRAVTELPPGHSSALAHALTHGGDTRRAALDAVAHDAYRAIAGGVLDAWAASPEPPSGESLAFALRFGSDIVERTRQEQTIEVVWTGPSSYEVPVRRTPEVMVALANEAKSVLWLVSFAAYKVPLVTAAIRDAANRGVDVRLVLETKEDSGGALTFDAKHAFASVADRVSVYAWPLDRRPVTENGRSSMHAKGGVADESAAYVTSANLTGHALDENMELGLLVRGGPVPRRLAAHFRALVEAGSLKRVG